MKKNKNLCLVVPIVSSLIFSEVIAEGEVVAEGYVLPLPENLEEFEGVYRGKGASVPFLGRTVGYSSIGSGNVLQGVSQPVYPLGTKFIGSSPYIVENLTSLGSRSLKKRNSRERSIKCVTIYLKDNLPGKKISN